MQNAKQSMINAGYSKTEVENASKQVSLNPIIPTTPPVGNEVKNTKQKVPKSKSKKTIIILTSILAFLIIVGALTAIFWDKILDFVT